MTSEDTTFVTYTTAPGKIKWEFVTDKEETNGNN